MHKSYRLLIVMIAALLLVGGALSACSNNSVNNGTASTNIGKAEGEAAGNNGTEAPVELTMFVDATWYPFQDWKGEIPEAITKATGVKPKITVATDDKQLALMVASGDLPDIVVSFNFKLMSDGNISLPYNEIFPKYAPSVKFDPVKELVNTVSDGNYYAIRNDFSTEAEWKASPYAHMMVPGLTLRKDILEGIGNPAIKTLEDLDKAFAAVKEKYPDMTPLILNPNWQRPYFDTQYGAAGGFADKDGKIEYYLRQDATRKSMLYVNSLYRNGYVTSENFAYKNESETEQMMVSGKGFAYTWTYSGADRLNASSKDSGYEFIQLAEPLGAEASVVSTGTGGLGMYVTKDNKNVEATVKFLEYLYSEEGWRTAEWGIEGKDWTWNEAGYPEFNYNVQDLETLKEKGVYWWGVPTETGVGMALSSYKSGSETTRQGEAYSKITTFNPAIGMINPDTDSQEQIIRTNIDNMVKTEVTKVYLAPTEAEAVQAYEEILKKAEKIGMSKLEAWATEQYGPLKEKYDSLTK
ncbi:extracellular solute-binding protein [Paenibacillus harenae]|uniref:extracellular solute-binding protein n=1 Tax=Paenibacillus harenae TaxID=306543 RepID=UPI00278E9106|nr:extracellular solute-binding protein [Paenibacillus harenae]MDQ0058781.1 putative aldouronate transport system substrate-binding protein [Paenibacillus harenae]